MENKVINEFIKVYWHLKKIRNLLVHGVEIPEDRELLLYVEEIKDVKKEIESFLIA